MYAFFCDGLVLVLVERQFVGVAVLDIDGEAVVPGKFGAVAVDVLMLVAVAIA